MGFAHPWVLLLLAAPAALLVREWRTRGTPMVLPLDHAGPPRARVLDALLRSAASLAPLLLAAAIVLLAGPTRLSEPRTRRVLTNIEFCLDVSGSMASPFGSGTRYEAAMDAINEFLDVRRGDAYGLTAFGSSVLHWVPLTSDPSAFRCARPFLNPMSLPPWFGGGTMIGMALVECMKVLSAREEGDRMIILVSDGYSFDLYGGADEEIARRLKAERISVYAIHAADGEAPGELHTIAGITGGAVFAAGNPEALKAVFKRIDEMKGTKLEKSAPEVMDDFGPTAAVGLCLLGSAALCLLGLRATPW
ncbi:MAG TPA: vWA domain-containing protein [Planctomycetota bacterium]|nr:vWA domain-containing protein [Planctomycetota bacterium]